MKKIFETKKNMNKTIHFLQRITKNERENHLPKKRHTKRKIMLVG